MPDRHLPVRPDLQQLKREAGALPAGIRAHDAEALADLAAFHRNPIDPDTATLADAQLVLARSYQAPSWNRLVLACRLTDAIWRDDLDAVHALIERHPRLLHESALVRPSNWGPPMSYAANLGRDQIIRMLYEQGARDLESAMDRAALQSEVRTAEMLYDLMGRPPLPEGILAGPAYTLSASGTEFALRVGARVTDEQGKRLAAPDVVLETDSRDPAAKHAILEMYVEYEIAQWLLERGAEVDRPAEVDRDGFGGHSALFGAVVSQPNFWMNHGDRPVQARFAQLLLDHGANPNAKASIRKRMHPGYGDDALYEYRDVTPVEYGMRFSHRLFVNERAMELILLHGGGRVES